MKSNPAAYTAKYKKLHNQVRAATRNDYFTYLDAITSDLCRNQKPFWNLLSKLDSCRHPIPVLKHYSDLVSSDFAKATLFNDYFVSVFTKEDSSNLHDLWSQLPSQPSFQLDNISISQSEVVEELLMLNVHKACGPDQMCPRLLKEGAEQLIHSLMKLFNHSISNGVLPQDWASANITPVYKKGDKHCVANYRPISLTCILCKVLEKIIHRKLYSLLESHHVLSDAQFGFRAKLSTVSLLLSVVHDWADTLNHRLSTHCIFIDFAKAFDSVPHERLLLKLEAIGITGALLQWFQAFLTTRRQRVVINGQFSNWSKVSSGVPQGSILGPLLFILYINDISSIVNARAKLFADDVTLYATIQSNEDYEVLQADLDSISHW